MAGKKAFLILMYAINQTFAAMAILTHSFSAGSLNAVRANSSGINFGPGVNKTAWCPSGCRSATQVPNIFFFRDSFDSS
jgi:hypothetical protein